ncbi:hypothetical protein LTR53_007301 [Teratosphaeriaceae sp. CCFEE 6253]|nr:hypothetical protein LTR53_007301 [Teratosphaeriaceae sp. CCFEE 6253]
MRPPYDPALAAPHRGGSAHRRAVDVDDRSQAHTIFHWPNFTFSHSQHFHPQHPINPRHIHDTLTLTHKPRPHFIESHRRHTVHTVSGCTARLPSHSKSRRSLKATKTAPAAVATLRSAMKDQYAPPPGPPPRRSNGNQQHVQFAPPAGPPGNSESRSVNSFPPAYPSAPQGPPPSDAPPAYAPPSGAPPGWQGDKKHHQQADELAPPSGPPPSHGMKANDGYAPPSGPPLSHYQQDAHDNEPEPPPYDPWMAVPDNALLPPPPSIFKDERSPTANATWDDAARAHDWCRRNPLWPAQHHSPATLQRISAGHISLTSPPNARNVTLTPGRPGTGFTHIRTSPRCTDTIFLSDLPLYTAAAQTPRTFYFELRVLHMGNVNPRTGEADAGIAIGFVAPPYPSWRLPGWQRASVGVHGDDGRRYADDPDGGTPFATPFKVGDVVGIGMRGGGSAAGVSEVFFTRNGREEGGWKLREERDAEAEDGDMRGLEGGNDVLGAVGVFGGVEAEVRFAKGSWLYRPA